MAKKEWREVPESELTEEEVRRGFNRLRELYKEMTYKLHERKIEISKKNVIICELRHDRYILRKENKHLKHLMEQGSKDTKKPEKISETKTANKLDFKKKFLDSL